MIHPQERQYALTHNLPPHPTLALALGSFVVEPCMRALDLGCGAGRDTRALVSAGFNEVVAVDKYPVAETYVRKNIPADKQAAVTFVADDYQDAYPDGCFDLINAQLTLSHNTPDTFNRVMELTRQKLSSGGLFVGNFFGDRHPYNQPGTQFTFLTRSQVEHLFPRMHYVNLDEREQEGPEPYAGERWHWFDIIVKNDNV